MSRDCPFHMHSIRCPKIITWIRNFQKSAQRRLVKLADAQADISFRCTHNLEGTVPHVGIQYLYVKMSCKENVRNALCYCLHF